MADSEVLASASVEIHPYLSPTFSAQLAQAHRVVLAEVRPQLRQARARQPREH